MSVLPLDAGLAYHRRCGAGRPRPPQIRSEGLLEVPSELEIRSNLVIQGRKRGTSGFEGSFLTESKLAFARDYSFCGIFKLYKTCNHLVVVVLANVRGAHGKIGRLKFARDASIFLRTDFDEHF